MMLNQWLSSDFLIFTSVEAVIKKWLTRDYLMTKQCLTSDSPAVDVPYF